MNRFIKHLKYPLRFPGIVPRSISNYVRIFLLAQPRLRGVEFAVTYACPCNCDHCSAAFLKHADRTPLSTAEIVEALDALWRLGAMNINLTGGEALTHPDLEAFVRASHPRSTVVSLATCGVGLDDRVANNLARWGVRVVTISLDSADRDTHDASRGLPGCYDAVLDATRHCKAWGIDVFWCTILTEENAASGDLMNMIRLAEQRGVTLTINLPCSVGGWSKKKFALSQKTRELHRELMKRPHVRWEGHSNYRREGCPAGIEKIYVSPYGDVMPCPFIHVSFGNLKQTPLPSIWASMLAGPFNKIRDGCPIADDPGFAERYIEPIYRQAEHPMPHERLRAGPKKT